MAPGSLSAEARIPVGAGRNRRASLALSLSLLAAGIASACTTATQAPLSCAQARDYRQEGIASWYGKAHHGRRTASGARFDMHALTAAHRSLPFGSRIKVTNTANGRSVVLTVNDRGPFIAGRLLDVSYRAARELNFARAGLAEVRIETVGAC